MEEQSWRCPACISGKMSTLSITDDAMMMMPEEEKEVDDQEYAATTKTKTNKYGEEVIGKRIRIFEEGWVLKLNHDFFKYAFEGDNGTMEILLLKDQMMELGIIEKEEDMDGQRIRVYDEGVVTSFRQKRGTHSVQLENGRTKVLILDQDHVCCWEWEWEWHLGKSQLPSIKRIWSQESPRKYWATTTSSK